MTQEKAAPRDFLGVRTKREASGMTLKDVFALTRISVVNLEAIENGDFPSLPVPVYTKNFIKTYAHALDLDSKPILDSYETYLKSLQTDRTSIPEQEAVKETIKEAVPKEALPEQEPFLKKPTQFKIYLAGAFIVIIAIVVAATIFQHQPLPNATDKPPAIIAVTPQTGATAPATPPGTQGVTPPVNLSAPPAPTTDPKAVVTQPIKQVSTLPALPQHNAVSAPSPKQNVSLVEKKTPVSVSEGADILVIKATETTWLRMKIDQNPPFQVLLMPGEEIKRKGAGFEVDIGNAGGVTVQFKGKVIDNLGKSGEVRHLQLP
jgi:cytoskeleton protein RodZ